MASMCVPRSSPDDALGGASGRPSAQSLPENRDAERNVLLASRGLPGPNLLIAVSISFTSILGPVGSWNEGSGNPWQEKSFSSVRARAIRDC